jgi:hypothetical protein
MKHWTWIAATLISLGLFAPMLRSASPASVAAGAQEIAADDPSLTLTRGSYSVSYNGGGAGGDIIVSLPQNMVVTIPNTAVIHTGKPGLVFNVTQCPNETDEHFFDRVDDFSHKVWARFGEPPVTTPGG